LDFTAVRARKPATNHYLYRRAGAEARKKLIYCHILMLTMDIVKKAYMEGTLHELEWTLQFFLDHSMEELNWILPKKQVQTYLGDDVITHLIILAHHPSVIAKQTRRAICKIMRAVMIEVHLSDEMYYDGLNYLAKHKDITYYMMLYDYARVNTSMHHWYLSWMPHPTALCLKKNPATHRYIDYAKRSISHALKKELQSIIKIYDTVTPSELIDPIDLEPWINGEIVAILSDDERHLVRPEHVQLLKLNPLTGLEITSIRYCKISL
jgi:hypothetical protein